ATTGPAFVTPGGTLISTPAGARAVLLRLRALAAREPHLVRYGGGFFGLVVLVLLLRCACARDFAPPPAPEPAPEAVAKSGKGKGKSDDKPAAKVESKAEPPAKDEPVKADVGEVPEAYAEAAQTILTGTNSKARKKAADTITGAPEEDKDKIPLYIRNLAWIEKIQRCEDKRAILLKIEEEGDLRALPGLQTIAKLPKKRCGGWFNERDCLECLRVDLGRVIGKFEAGG
ncbi:MAG TPA: hypothetical protein VIK91_26930, partial [Nannocystis sp.]